ncbi:MAG: ATP-binding cassette domain-containing protein [Treponema sp.]|jgi:ATPase subunit of ABC transporter with duplicated ATPase domains|nr:ATP-binding cassette domain-containing protein [Treponema sp.]
MATSFLAFNSVEFTYPSQINPALRELNFEITQGWTGVTGENGAGKSTLLLLAAGHLQPDTGNIRRPKDSLYCPQHTDDIPEYWEELFFAADNAAGRLLDRLGIEADWPYRWETLSCGERKRLQVAAVLWQNPALLAMDEPTNHLDAETRTLVREALKNYRGIGLLVSHDRTLLDELCGNCLFLRDGTVTLRPGGVSRGRVEEERERTEQRDARKKLRDEGDRLAAEADRRRRAVESSSNRLSKRRLDPKDHDGRGKINMARLSGKDTAAANLYKRMKNRTEKVEAALGEAANPHDRKRGLTLTGERARRDRLFLLEAGKIPLGDGRALCFPELTLQPDDRIALTGPNGAGKSTLIRHILPLVPAPALYLPQELSAEESRRILEAALTEEETVLGAILSRFSRLGSDPRLLFRSAMPSPGEIRKLVIARGLLSNPSLVIMDEPVNHLDMNSVELLEEALTGYAGALLLVSHDELFLSRLITKEWRVSTRGGDSSLTVESAGF